MKKEEFLALLNKNPDSISLHDAILLFVDKKTDSITFTVCIGEYNYSVNNLDKYVDNIKNEVVLTLQFNGIKNYVEDKDENLQVENSDILDNCAKNGEFLLKIHGAGAGIGIFSFNFSSFQWDIVGEFNEKEYKKWEKSTSRTKN